MTDWAAGRPSSPVVIVPHDPEWPRAFQALKAALADALEGLELAVEHVGSTAVPGLAAKPIMDLVVVIASRDVLPEVIRRLGGLGYHHEGDKGVAGREAFRSGGAVDVPRDGSGRCWPAHHLYVCAADCDELRRHLLFRDYLRSHPGKAAEYGSLKVRLAQLHRHDRNAYTEAKSEFVEAVLREAEADARTSDVAPLPGEGGR